MSDTRDISDEVLMAYIDGELSPAERAAVAAALERDPYLRERLASFSFTRGPMARVYDEALLAPMPARLLAIAGVGRPAAQRKREPAREGWLWRIASALTLPMLSPAAAIPALAMAAAAGWLLQGAMRSDGVSLDGGGVVAAAALQSVLDTTPTGQVARVGSGLSIRPELTFASVQSGWCRQYELILGEDMRAGGLACREQDAWKVIVQTPATRAEAPGAIVPAGHEDPLEAVRETLKAGDVLSPEQEQPLIRGHWPPPR
jgi:hypothetical protein